MSLCLIGLGANLGDRRETLHQAVGRLDAHPGVRLVGVSRWIETQPVGGPGDQPPYLNGVATVETTLSPRELLAVLHEIENQLGRRRDERWAARTIDLDLLIHENHIERSDVLVVPHPRMAWRRFVLEPAVEVAPSMVHPTIGWTVEQLWNHLNATPYYMAMTGATGCERTELARRVADRCGANVLLGFEPPTLVGPPDDSAGDEPAMGLECLRQQARLLSAGSARWVCSDRPTVSDFWLDELRAWAWERLAPDELDTFFHVWRRKSPHVVRPRLVVRLAGRSSPWLDRQLCRMSVGPVLHIDDPRSVGAVDEVVAAIGGMK